MPGTSTVALSTERLVVRRFGTNLMIEVRDDVDLQLATGVEVVQ